MAHPQYITFFKRADMPVCACNFRTGEAGIGRSLGGGGGGGNKWFLASYPSSARQYQSDN